MKKWKYKLENEGRQLKKLIDEGDLALETVINVYNQMIVCLKLLKIKLIGRDKTDLSYQIDCMIEDYELARPEDTDSYNYYEEEENLNFNLRGFYDFCDDNRVWIGL